MISMVEFQFKRRLELARGEPPAVLITGPMWTVRTRRHQEGRERAAQRGLVILRRAAYLRELSSLGLSQAQSAKALGISRELCFLTAKRVGLKFKRKRVHQTPLMLAVLEGYKAGIPAKTIAENTGSTPGSVRAIANRIGIACADDPARFRRGFSVPKELKEEFNFLRDSKRFTVWECREILDIPWL